MSRIRVVLLSVLLATLLVPVPAAPAAAQEEPYDVLVFHRTTGFRHPSIPAAIAAIEALGTANGFSVTETQDASVFTDEGLRPYEALVFLTDGEGTLDAAQRTAFERYIQRGGGFVGIHGTANMDKEDWPWWRELMGGALFVDHPPIQDGTVEVEDPAHPLTDDLPNPWPWEDDEFYNFSANPRDAGVKVLLTVDESSYTGGTMGEDHPIAWCSDYDGGRTFYSALGHSDAHYADADYREFLLGGIEYAAGVVEADCGEPREGIPTAAAFEKIALDDNTQNPMRLEVAPDGRVFYIELAGTVKVWHPDTQAISVAANIDVYRDQENGLLGIALDPDFETNNWVYLFYSDPEESVQNLSRFTLDPVTETLDPSSERLLLEVPHQREECCHSAGDLEFGPDGNLYLSTGDDTNPFGSDGFGPFDYREGREPWDAARSSANTADLRGKILRITPLDDPGAEPGPGSTYTIPEGNLFPPDEYDPEVAFPEIYVMGLRNPFAISVDPESGALWYGQVGPDANPAGGFNPDRGPRGYDYWNRVTEAANFGWPFCVIVDQPYLHYDFATGESGAPYDCAGGPINDSPNNDGLEQLPPVPRPPTLWYPYCNGQGGYTAPPEYPEIPCGPFPGGAAYGTGRAAFMGDVYHYDPEVDAEGQFPAYYDDTPFIMEWERDFLATIEVDESGDYVEGSFEEFLQRWRYDDSLRFRKPHDMEFGPDGNMYLIEWGDDFNFAGSGVNPDSGLYRISYVKGGRTPLARASAEPDSGQAPLEVSFSSAGTEDPDGDEITYAWDFGDGTTSTEPNPTHTYDENGVYTAQLTVTDTTDRSSSSNVRIVVGNTRPEVTIEIPNQGQIFDWGDEIPYRISVTDAEEGSTDDGGIDCADVVVQRGLYHASGGGAHVHPGPTQNGCEGTIQTQADADHGEGADIATVITASYTDDGGAVGTALTGGTTHLLQPQRREAENYTDAQGVTTADSGDTECCGGAVAGADGDWTSYEPYNLEGIDQITLRAAALQDTTVELRRDAPDGELLATADIPATATIDRTESREGFGNAVRLNGDSPNEYVEMPTGILSDLDGDFTISTWVNRATLGQTWSRIFDFGNGTSEFLFLTPNAGSDNFGMRVDINPGGGSQFIPASGGGEQLPTGWQHVALTLSGDTGTIWLNGEPFAVNENITARAADLGETTQNWIGRSQFAADPLLNATIDDFNIFSRALSQEEIQDLMAEPGGGDLGGGDVAWYRFDEESGETAVDSSGTGNDAAIVLGDEASSYTEVTVDIPETEGTFPLYLVFPGAEARVNWLHFGELGEEPEPEPEVPSCVTPAVDEFDGDALDESRWNVVERNDDNLSVADGSLAIQTVSGRDFFAGQGTLPNVVVQPLPDGSWTATTQLSWNPAQNFQNAGMVVWADEDNYVKAGMVHADQRAFELIKESGGTPEFLGNVAAGTEFPTDFWMRYVYDGSTLTAEFSADGSTWTEIGTTDLAGLDAPQVGVYATNSTAGTATTPPVAEFGSFDLDFAFTDPASDDEFDGTELDVCRWDRTVRYDGDLLDVNDGTLDLTTTDEDIFQGQAGMPNIVLQDAPDGDWTVETKLTAPLTRNFQNAGLMVYDDDDNYLKLGVLAVNQPGAARDLAIEMGTEVEGTAQFPFVNDQAGVPDDNDEWWLRLTKSGNTYSAQWSADGATWTDLSADRTIELEDPAVGLYATGSSAQGQDQAVTVSFDYFRLVEDVAEPPTVSASLDPTEPGGEDGWYTSPVTISLSSDDDEAALQWRLAGDEDWIDWTEPVTVSDDGVYDIEFRATNDAGSSDVGVVSFRIDATGPTVTADVDGDDSDEVTVTLTADDADGSGVGLVEYQVDGGGYQPYDGAITLTEPGEHTIGFHAFDVAGNMSAHTDVTVTVAEPTACPDPDPSDTVVIGGVDTGVPNVDVGDGCTIDDLIDDDSSWRNRGQFVRHVNAVLRGLYADGLIDARDRAAIIRAAARSGVADRPRRR